MMDFQTPPLPLSGIVRNSEPPSPPLTSAMSRKNSRNLVYVKSKKPFLLLALFYNYKCEYKKSYKCRKLYIYHYFTTHCRIHHFEGKN